MGLGGGSLPFLGVSGKDARSLIVKTLSQGFELNAVEIHRAIRQESSVCPSYQGIHKAVKLLLEQGVLEKNGNGYFLSSKWAVQVKEFGEGAATAAQGANLKQLLEMPQNASATLSFDGLFVDSFNTLLSATEQVMLSQPDDTPLISHSKHAWAMTVVSGPQYKQLKNIAGKAKHYILCAGNTKMDEFLLEFWKKQLNSEWKYSASAAQKCDLVVAGDFVVQIFHEPAFASKWHEIYSRAKTKKEVELSNLYKLIFEQPTKTKLVIARNEALAHQLRAETLSRFKS